MSALYNIMTVINQTHVTVFSFALACLFTGIYALIKLARVGQRPKGLPPGPRTLPILGNLHAMPTFKPYKVFAEWGKIYGPVYSLMVGSNPLVMIQSQQAAKELLDKRGSNYSSRPDLYIFSELSSRGLRQVAMKYNTTWRQIHRINHKILNAAATRAYTPYQILESRQMLVDILDSPDHYETHIQRYSNSVTCQMVYGFRTTSWSDPKLQSVVSIFFDVCDLAVTVSARLMDCYPILKKIPRRLLPVCRKALDIDRRCMSVFLSRWLEVKKNILDDVAMPCFCKCIVEAQTTEGFSDELASYIAGDIIEAGSSTVSDELLGFLMAMVTHPDVQRRAQREIDTVVGPNRLPQLEDMELLPYIRGCVKETLRWMPTTALLVPHSPLKDDIYQNCIIPAGASVVVNVWALNMDPATWPQPHVFDPLRFKGETRSEHEVATSSDPTSLRHNYIFGAGRRLCQGIHIAERSLFLTMACLLWGFDISTPNPTSIDTEDLRGGLAVVPAPFDCHFKPRNNAKVDVMRREWQQQRAKFLDPSTEQWIRVPEGAPLSTSPGGEWKPSNRKYPL
ncbi:cytochrome P450 [Hypoxylon argillaceum]|nr:cytochrome P450 [Hypoxylon argillaceum]